MIVVFGSINIDFVTRAKIPAPGETTLGGDYSVFPGGKGANQALAARRAGAKVALVGACGADGFAAAALALLRDAGVDLAATRQVAKPTGAAFIVVDPSGENAVVVASGANSEARAEQLEGVAFGPGDLLLLQRETPEAEVDAAALLARRRGAKVMLNLAPAGAPSEALLGALDYLCVNEHEAATLGAAAQVEAREPEAIAAALGQRYGFATIVTLGSAGAIGFLAGTRVAATAPKVSAIDTTAAGDAFVGAFAAALDVGLSFAAAMRRGVIAGSLACTKIGAQTSLPSGEEIAAIAKD
ncbi:MAG: ribokinase [Bradyrhizobium sp.]|nr:MAG: ribokinase [Bradyrhizobium sp.]